MTNVADMDPETIVSHLDADLAAAEAHLRAILGRLEEAQATVRELTHLREGFVVAVDRYGDASFPDSTCGMQASPHPWLALSQTDAVLAALAEISRPASTIEVYEKLVKAGRPENSEQVRSALGYLNRRAKKVNRMARGLWELP